jgi:hypothetical protein
VRNPGLVVMLGSPVLDRAGVPDRDVRAHHQVPDADHHGILVIGTVIAYYVFALQPAG